MNLIRSKYSSDNDYWLIRQFLREVFLLNDRREVSWPLYRWDYWRWHVNENIFQFNLEAAVWLWKTSDDRLAAVLHPARAGEAFLQVHPAFHTLDLDVEMILAAETQYATTQSEGSQRLIIWVHETDLHRQDLLKRRGYLKEKFAEYQRRCCLDKPIPDFPPPEGYTIRSLGDLDEHPQRSWVSWKAFHPNEPDEAYQGWDWYRNVQRAQLYSRDLDLVAIAPDGEFAAFCTLWFDDVTRTAAFEPVGTHPAHQRKGLGKAIMVEGLRRVRDLGATLCTVGSYSVPAGNLYSAVGFIDFELSEAWVKQW